jgi:hypothetical protein
MAVPPVSGSFVDFRSERWYALENYHRMEPFFVALTGDSDLWAFVSTNGSLAAGRRDQEGSFLPYETVDKIHTRWETTGPRTWVRWREGGNLHLWEPFARRPGLPSGQRSLWKNLTGTRLLFREVHPDGNLCFEQEWSSAADLGVVRRASLRALKRPLRVEVLDGLLNLVPPGETNATYNANSMLADAYKWNESHAGGRLGVFTMYAQLWDRAEPKESLQALVAWHSGLAGAHTLLSARQVEAFCEGHDVTAETLTRGERSAFLVAFGLEAAAEPAVWYQVVDGALSQARVADLAARLEAGAGTPEQIEASLEANTRGLAELLRRADGFQTSADEMAAAHHTANVLFNTMRGGVFPEGTLWRRDDLLAFVKGRNRPLAAELAKQLAGWPEHVERHAVLEAVRNQEPQLERLVSEYLPLTFSRRHGDPSRPWNRFSIRVRDAQGQRVLDHQGNWRDIFQNWEALLWSQPEYAGSMIATFLSAMTPDGYNPYRVMRQGIEWETIEADDPWSFIGYWGDHQVVYLLRLLEAAQAFEPGLLARLWTRPVFSFAAVPYRIKSYSDLVANPKSTITFDHHAHEAALKRAAALGGDGKLVLDACGLPVLGTLAEKLVILLIAKVGNFVPGGGVWLNTQRPEWNDANNALVGQGLSLVTLASLRRFLKFLEAQPFLDAAMTLPQETALALNELSTLAAQTSLQACTDPVLRRQWLDRAGAVLEAWRTVLYTGWASRREVPVPQGAAKALVHALLPLVDATLTGNRRDDGLYHSYNLLTLTPGCAEVGHLYPMLEGQVAVLSSGLLTLEQTADLARALRASALFDERRRSYLLYPDRRLPGFLEKNVLDAQALALPAVKALLEARRTDVFEVQADGRVRFAPTLANRFDVEAALADRPDEARVVADAYHRLLGHQQFTGRSGTMFGFEGLGCIYWHMVAKLLVAVQEAVFQASDVGSPRLAELKAFYHDVRDGIGYRKSPAEYGAFPFDPYSHTPGEGGARQPGMTGQVKEEILTRWGELGLRWRDGSLHFDPVLLDASEIPQGGALDFTYQRVPFSYTRGARTAVRVQTDAGWVEANGVIPWKGARRVEATIA